MANDMTQDERIAVLTARIDRLTRERDAAVSRIATAREERSEHDMKVIDQLTRLVDQTRAERAKTQAGLEAERLRVTQLGDVVAKKQAALDEAETGIAKAKRAISTLEGRVRAAEHAKAKAEAEAEAAKSDAAQAKAEIDQLKVLLRARIERERIDGVAI